MLSKRTINRVMGFIILALVIIGIKSFLLQTQPNESTPKRPKSVKEPLAYHKERLRRGEVWRMLVNRWNAEGRHRQLKEMVHKGTTENKTSHSDPEKRNEQLEQPDSQQSLHLLRKDIEHATVA
ncbi:unnamed protein product [Calicophoron daubneyi]|uniref:Uncharacterized protein n=1 Tax=Calicophoron daubneyi TaxID=300641 RepID=A0AAV2T8N2_CALDB